MPIKLIVFDLDGVLVETKSLHYSTLNEALQQIGPEFLINWEDHLNKFDGLKTREKLDLLTSSRGLPRELHDKVWKKKQRLTLENLNVVQSNEQLRGDLTKLLNAGYTLACCSNAVRETVKAVLLRLGVFDLFSFVYGNEDVSLNKPHPEVYWAAMSAVGCLPEETLIIEDSPVGLLAAHRSGAFVWRVTNPKDLTYVSITKNIEKANKSSAAPKWVQPNLNILIPMAGAGSRFEKAGYRLPKPLIDVQGSPMIKVVVDNVNIDANYIFIVQRSHRLHYNLDSLLSVISPNCKVLEVDGLTEGAACTALMAEELIDNDSPLFFANSDQFVEWNSNEFMYKMQETQADGGIVTFKATESKWSFAKVDPDTNLVTEVAEKNPISDTATVGFYYWKRGGDFVKYAKQMIANNCRVNNEFYVCPVFNQAIADGKKIKVYQAERMWGLGTPEDLEIYLKKKDPSRD